MGLFYLKLELQSDKKYRYESILSKALDKSTQPIRCHLITILFLTFVDFSPFLDSIPV